jgi:transposase-like protein
MGRPLSDGGRRKPVRHRFSKGLIHGVQYFADEDVALDFAAHVRWPKGEQACPRCGVVAKHYFLKTQRRWKCRGCRQQFSFKVGTVFEDSRLPLSKWLQAVWLVANQKHRVSSYDLAHMLGITQKSAWLMLRRIRGDTTTLARAINV